MPHANRSKRGDNPARNPSPEEVQAKRLERGWSFAEAAKIAFLTGQYWEDVESGKKRMHPATWQYWLLMTDGELVPTLLAARQHIELTLPLMDNPMCVKKTLDAIERIEKILGGQ